MLHCFDCVRYKSDANAWQLQDEVPHSLLIDFYHWFHSSFHMWPCPALPYPALSSMLNGQPTYQHLLFRCPPCCMDIQHFDIYYSDSRHATWTAYHSTFTLHINAMLHVQLTFQHLLFTIPPQSVTCLGSLQLHFCDFLLHQGHLITWIPRATWHKVTGHTSQFY